MKLTGTLISWGRSILGMIVSQFINLMRRRVMGWHLLHVVVALWSRG